MHIGDMCALDWDARVHLLRVRTNLYLFPFSPKLCRRAEGESFSWVPLVFVLLLWPRLLSWIIVYCCESLTLTTLLIEICCSSFFPTNLQKSQFTPSCHFNVSFPLALHGVPSVAAMLISLLLAMPSFELLVWCCECSSLVLCFLLTPLQNFWFRF